MKIKVYPFEKSIREKYYKILCIIYTLLSLFICFWEIPPEYKCICGYVFVIIASFLYLLVWFRANKLNNISLFINNSNVDISFGDIFEEDGIKVIAFNEYFDTNVDERIIASNSLNGKFINKYKNDLNEIDQSILDDSFLTKRIIEKNEKRTYGKKIKFKLGTVTQYKDFLLVAFSHFDDDNRAYLSMQDLLDCLLELWNEIDRVYAGRTVILPLLGSGITRLKETGDITEQDLLEILLWSFKISRIKFSYPSRLKILVLPEKLDKVNLYKIKCEF